MKEVSIICFLVFNSLVAAYAQCLSTNGIQDAIDEAPLEQLEQIVKDTAQCEYADSLKGDLLHTIGLLYYFDGHLVEAIAATKLALTYRQKSISPNSLKMGKSNHNLGVFLQLRFQYNQAINYFKSALDIYTQLGLSRAIDSSRELSACYGLLGEYGLAQRYLSIAIRLAEKQNEEALIAECTAELGKLFLQRGEYEKAIDTLLKANERYQKMPNDEEQNLATNKAICLHNIGYAWDAIKDYSKAIYYYNQSLLIARGLQNKQLTTSNLINLGITYRKIGERPAALAFFKQALNYLENESADHMLRAMCYDNIGDVFFSHQQYQDALANYHKAVCTLVPNMDSTQHQALPQADQLNTLSQPEDLVVYLMDKAKAWQALYHQNNDQLLLSKALQAYKLADQLHDSMRLQQLSKQARNYWRGAAKKLYENALNISFILQDYEAAFFFFEKSKSILLLEALMAQETQQFLPAAMVEKEIQLQEKINSIFINQSLNQGSLSTTEEQELLKAQENYRSFLKHLSQEHAPYFNLRYASEMQSLQQAKKALLDEHTHLIHYFEGEQFVYVLRLSAQDQQLVRIPQTQVLQDSLQKFFSYFEDRSRIATQPQAFKQISQHIYEKLYASVWPEGKIPADTEATILPDGIISLIPFDALIVPKKEASQGATSNYLVFQQLIRYAYSATVLHYQQKRSNTTSKKKSIAFFAPFINNDQEQVALPFSQTVKAYLKKHFKGSFFTGPSANYAAFSKHLQSSNIIHLSTHASAGDSLQNPSFILSDTTLYLPSLYTLPLDAQLVILSACETGLGQIQKGEGVNNLAQGFAYAGTSGLITSLWRLDDKSASDLMQRFYHHLDQGLLPAKALHRAKTDYLINPDLRSIHTSPYYWGGLAFWGYDAPVPLAHTYPVWIWVVIPLLLLLAGLYFYWKRKG